MINQSKRYIALLIIDHFVMLQLQISTSLHNRKTFANRHWCINHSALLNFSILRHRHCSIFLVFCMVQLKCHKKSSIKANQKSDPILESTLDALLYSILKNEKYVLLHMTPFMTFQSKYFPFVLKITFLIHLVKTEKKWCRLIST